MALCVCLRVVFRAPWWDHCCWKNGSEAVGEGLVFAAVDVQYLESGQAWAALVGAESATFPAAVAERVVVVDDVAPYVPGEFWRRELPCLRAVLDGVAEVELLVVDGYVDLDPSGRPGLGAYAREAFAVPVIGVAKTRFVSATHAVPVLRGTSGAVRPLYVTATGLPMAEAAAMVREMAGRYRVPDGLRRVDALARGHGAPSAMG
jgi:deoxyribonuclease V